MGVAATKWGVTLAVVLAHVLVWSGRARLVSEPYMDEIFHVPQAQRYCKGEFDYWDDKITTFPGMYLVAAVPALVSRAASRLAGWEGEAAWPADPCSTLSLRLLNGVVFGGMCALLSFEIVSRLHPKVSDLDVALNALAVSLFPVHFFCADLFYTDAGSLATIMLSLLCCLNKRHHLSALAATAAVLFRQTNVVWAAFVLAYDIQNQLEPPPVEAKGPEPSFAAALARILGKALVHRRRLARNHFPMVALLLSFVVFVARNGGVVLGDREAHRPAPHLVQFFYCGLAVACARFPAHFGPESLRDAKRALLGGGGGGPRAAAPRLLMASALLLGTLFVVSEFTMVHPYTLADNRHYTFYVWRRFLGRSRIARLSLSAPYLLSLHSLARALHRTQSQLVVFAYFACAACTVIMAELLEFRYFVVPYAVCSLLAPPLERRGALAVLGAFAAVDIGLEWVFLRRTYVWPDGSIARFMW